MFSLSFGRKRPLPMVQQQKAEQLLPHFRTVIVPALGAHFARRALRTACRMARMHADSEVRLVYCIEVPRAFAMAAMLPGEEAMADDVLATGAVTVENYGCKVTTEIQRGRDFSETLIKYAAQHSADLIVLGARSDGLRGLPLHVAREVYDRMTVPVILDFFAGASNAKPSSDQLPLDSPSLEA